MKKEHSKIIMTIQHVQRQITYITNCSRLQWYMYIHIHTHIYTCIYIICIESDIHIYMFSFYSNVY